MKYYVAPMEGITNYTWRKVHRECFPGADQYYSPFMVATSDQVFQPKELKDVLQGEKDLIPQVLTNRPEYFIWAAKDLLSKGFQEVNLNMGCPSGTVVSKGKGSGMLADLKVMENTLDSIFDALPDSKISIKTRIGCVDPMEWKDIFKIFEKYPICELTVHPRVQKEGYRGKVHREIFEHIYESYPGKLIYNGDVNDLQDLREMESRFPELSGIMMGRGLLMNPSLIRQAKGGEKATREELIHYHQRLIEEYQMAYHWDNATICHMKELWTYFKESFEDSDDFMKLLLKSKNMGNYLACTNTILNQCKLK